MHCINDRSNVERMMYVDPVQDFLEMNDLRETMLCRTCLRFEVIHRTESLGLI